MNVLVRCPECPEKHKRFVTTAHVVEEWVVNERGDYQDTKGVLEVVHRPDPGNHWHCYECGADAIVMDLSQPVVALAGAH